MDHFLERIANPTILIPLGAFAVGALAVIFGCIQQAVRAHSRAKVEEAELQLKRELAAQGRSADEIERIMKTQSNG